MQLHQKEDFIKLSLFVGNMSVFFFWRSLEGGGGKLKGLHHADLLRFVRTVLKLSLSGFAHTRESYEVNFPKRHK